MVDTRFHPGSGPQSLAALLAQLDDPPTVVGALPDDLTISGADNLDTAQPGSLALAAHPRYRDALRQTRAGAVVIHPEFASDVPPGTVALAHRRAHEVFVDLLCLLYPAGTYGMAAAMLDFEGAEPVVERGVRLGPNVVLGADVEIGRNTVIGANTTIGRGVCIGRDCIIGPNVSIECAYLGNGVVLHAGARIGSEGFGWLDHGRSNRKIPQLGRAILQDRVEIGANSAVDRGALGDTVIGENTKIDNLVQVGHNVHIGRNCLVAGLSGFSGGASTGDSVMFGAGALAGGHLHIGDASILSAFCYVSKDVPEGTSMAGYPAQELRAWRREIATLRRLNKRGS